MRRRRDGYAASESFGFPSSLSRKINLETMTREMMTGIGMHAWEDVGRGANLHKDCGYEVVGVVSGRRGLGLEGMNLTFCLTGYVFLSGLIFGILLVSLKFIPFFEFLVMIIYYTCAETRI